MFLSRFKHENKHFHSIFELKFDKNTFLPNFSFPKMVKNGLLGVQGTGKSIKNGSALFGVFSPTWAQHNAIVTDPESLLDIAGRSVVGGPTDSGKQCNKIKVLI